MKSGYIRTATGKKFYPLNCQPDQFCIEDIAAGLSNACRYAGQFPMGITYSVARHSVIVSNYVPKDMAMHGLMHDAAEAFLGDVIKSAKVGLPDYKELEEEIYYTITTCIGFSPITPPEVKEWDNLIMKEEYLHFFPQYYNEDIGDMDLIKKTVVPHHEFYSSPSIDRNAFLARYWQLKSIQ